MGYPINREEKLENNVPDCSAVLGRRDVLMPRDARERKGSFFTPKQWVELSRQYIADVLGEDWQDEYYVWDCAAGTGNLLVGLTNKYNVWASTLDKADVDVMRERIRNGANLLESHVFQFDFLNDDFSQLPQGLQDIIADEKKRKKLVVYINPPYAEADNRKGEGRSGVAVSAIHKKYSEVMGYAKREMYIQFLTRMYKEIPSCRIAVFSKLKNLQAPRCKKYREAFQARLNKMFMVPARTFDNVTGEFPIGFTIWDTGIQEKFHRVVADVFDHKGNFAGKKIIESYDEFKFINDWVKTFRRSEAESIATIIAVANDFQHNNTVQFEKPHVQVSADNHHWQITKNNLMESCMYFTVRKIIPADWLNDRDQFTYPNENWRLDEIFQTDCLTYTLFSGHNNIQAAFGTNNWIPFTEREVHAGDTFASHFMTQYIAGAIRPDAPVGLFAEQKTSTGGKALNFSSTAKAVFSAGKELWKYYHAQPDCSVNASFYDIRAYFQGRNAQGRMNASSKDDVYTKLLENLRASRTLLEAAITPKVYEYGFLQA